MQKLLLKLKPYLRLFLSNYMPRWIIFGIDLAIVMLAFYSLWLFRDTIALVKGEYMMQKLAIVLFVFGATSIIFRTYHGVVRFSSIGDLRRVVQAAIAGTITYEAGSFIIFLVFPNTFVLASHLWFPAFLGFMILAGQLLFRFTIRSSFEYLEQSNTIKRTRTFILGADAQSIQLTNYLISEKSFPYKPVAFITMENGKANKKVCGIPILHVNGNLVTYMKEYKVNCMLVTKTELDSLPRAFYDRCIVEGLELLLVNSISKYNDHDTPPQINKIKIEDLLGRNTIEMNREVIEDQFTGQTILITGAAGSIGGELARQVVQFRCKKVVLVDQAETPLNDLWLELTKLNTGVEIKPIVASVSHPARMRQIFDCAKPSLVFHAAAYKHVPMMEHHPSTAVVTNVFGTKICADLSIEYGVKRFVMISTDKAVNPTNVMGASKRAAEMYIQSLHHKQNDDGIGDPTLFVTTRFGNVLGSNGSVVPLFKRQIEEGGPVTITDREITRYFMSIPEACSLVLEAGCNGDGGKIYIFDMGEAVKIYDLAEKMIRLSGKVPGRDIKIVETGLRAGEKLYEELLANTEDTMPTYHKKVMIAKVRKYSYSYVSPAIDSMVETALKYTLPKEVVRHLKIMIPEFKSQNSQYEEIDRELEKSGVHETVHAHYVFDK